MRLVTLKLIAGATPVVALALAVSEPVRGQGEAEAPPDGGVVERAEAVEAGEPVGEAEFVGPPYPPPEAPAVESDALVLMVDPPRPEPPADPPAPAELMGPPFPVPEAPPASPSYLVLLPDAPQEVVEVVEKDESPRSRASVAADEIEEVLEESAEPEKPAIIRNDPITLLEQRWKKMNSELDAKARIRLGIAYTALLQHASAGPGRRTAAGGDFDLYGRWLILNEPEGWTGTLGFATEFRHQIGSITPAELGVEIGSQWRTSRGFGEDDYGLTELWWRQRLFDDLMVLRFGKLNAKHMNNTNRLSSQNFFFVNEAFADNPARTFPANSWGVDLRVQPTKDWYVSGSVQQASDDRVGLELGSTNGVAYALEFGYTPEIKDVGHGNYRFTVWHIDESDRTPEPEYGFALSFDQEVGDRVIPFLRYAINDADSIEDGDIDRLGTRQVLALGVGVSGAPHRPDDYWGAGLAWGQPRDGDLRDQWTGEMFYRFQLTPTQQLTLGVQGIVDPSNAPDDDLIGVFQVRWRVAF
jgi:porin